MVCVAEFLAAGADCGANGRESAARRWECAAAFCGESVSACAAAAGAGSDLAILVHDARRKTFARHLVEKAATGALCSHAGTPIGRKNCGLGVATYHGTAGMKC